MVELPFNLTVQTCGQTAVNKRTRFCQKNRERVICHIDWRLGEKKEDFIGEQFVKRWETSEQRDFMKRDRWHGQMYPVFVPQLLYIKTLPTGNSSEEFSRWSFYFGWELWKQRADGVYELQCKQVDGVQLHLCFCVQDSDLLFFNFIHSIYLYHMPIAVMCARLFVCCI